MRAAVDRTGGDSDGDNGDVGNYQIPLGGGQIGSQIPPEEANLTCFFISLGTELTASTVKDSAGRTCGSPRPCEEVGPQWSYWHHHEDKCGTVAHMIMMF